MSKPYTSQAATLIGSSMRDRGVMAFDPLVILNFLTLLLPMLMNICQKPTPQQGFDHLTWRPYRIFDWWGGRLAAHRKSIENGARSQWNGDDAGFRDVMQGIWSRVDDRTLTINLMTLLYNEAGA